MPTLRTEEERKLREDAYNRILDEQFDLTYYMNYTFEDCEIMTTSEREGFYNRLIKRKQTEKEQREQAMEKMNAGSKPALHRHRRR